MRALWYNYLMKTQEISTEKLLNIIEEKDLKIAELEQKIQWFMEQLRKKTRLTTDKLPEDIPVEVVEHELLEAECFCPDCDGELHVMGREIREELKIIPAKAVLVQHIQYIYACRNCEETSELLWVVGHIYVGNYLKP